MTWTKMNMAARRYGVWSGNPKGTKYDPARCAEEVWPSRGWSAYQCSRACGHGPDGLYCKQHARHKEER